MHIAISLVAVGGSAQICFAQVPPSLSDSVDALRPELTNGESGIEFRNESDLKSQPPEGYRKVSISELFAGSKIDQREPEPQPLKVHTRVRWSNGQLGGFTELEFAPDAVGREYTFRPFNAAISSTKIAPLGQDAVVETAPSYFDHDGNGVFELSKSSIFVPWVIKDNADDSKQKTYRYSIQLPTTAFSKFELVLDPKYEPAHGNIRFQIKRDQASSLDQSEDSEWPGQIWEADCGLVSNMAFEIVERQSTANKPIYVYNSEQIDWIIQQAGLEINASYIFDSVGTPERISIAVDPGIHIRTITWDQQSIEWYFDPVEELIYVTPQQGDGMFAGTQHRLAINGMSAWQSDSDPDSATRALPAIRLADGLPVEGRGSISLHSDWELVDFYALDASLVSRSGTTVKGGISRLDYNWRLSEPEVGVKLARRSRLRAASVYMSISNEGDQAVANVRMRINSHSQIWNTLAGKIGKDWMLDSCEIDNSSNATTSIVADPGNEAKIIIAPAIEAQSVELSLRLRANIEFSDLGQAIKLPTSIPVWFDSINQDVVVEFVPPSGYAIGHSSDLIHSVESPTNLDAWQQPLVQSRDHLVRVESANQVLPVAQFLRQRPGVATQSAIYVNRSGDTYQCDYLLECIPDQAGVQTIQLRIPKEATSLIWRILSKDQQVLQQWQWSVGESDRQSNSPDSLWSNILLPCDRTISGPFIFQCKYALPSSNPSIYLASVPDLANHSCYVLVEPGFAATTASDHTRDPNIRASILQQPDAQGGDLQRLVSIFNRFGATGNLYLVDSPNRPIKLLEIKKNSTQLVVNKSFERLYCQADGTLLYEIDIDDASLEQKSLMVSLPKPWKMISVSSDQAEFHYIERDLGDRLECELNSVAANDVATSLRLRWKGPNVRFRYGYGSFTAPTVRGNFLSMMHQSAVLLHKNYFAVTSQQDLGSTALQNLRAIGSPWNWGSEFVHEREVPAESNKLIEAQTEIDFPTDSVQTKEQTFRDFRDAQTSFIVGQFDVATKRIIHLFRWIAFIVSFIVFYVIIRCIPWSIPVVLMCGMISLVFLMPSELIVASTIGLLVAVITQIIFSILASSAKTSELTSSAGARSKESREVLGSSLSQKGLGLTRVVIMWVLLQQSLLAQEVSPPVIRPEHAENSNKASVIVPVDVGSMRVANYGLVKVADTQTELPYVLLAAEHSLAHKRVLSENIASLTSTYRFLIHDENTSISFPVSNSFNSAETFLVDGAAQYLSKNLEFSSKSRLVRLVWHPRKTGEVTVNLKSPLRLMPSDGYQTARVEILPCAAAQLILDSNLEDTIQIFTGKGSAISAGTIRQPLGPIKDIEIRWNEAKPRNDTVGTASSQIQYDTETQVFLSQAQPVAMTKIRVFGTLDKEKELTLEWNSSWKPVGENFRDVIKNGPFTEATIDSQRCMLVLQKDSESTTDSGVDLEIYWVPANSSTSSLVLPDPKIIGAYSNARTLRYSKNPRSAWTLSGTDNWAVLTVGQSNNSGVSSTNSSNTTLLRVPETSNSPVLHSNLSNQDRVNVQVHADYIIGQAVTSVQWRGSLVPSYVRTRTQAWIVDNRLKVESVKINNQDALFAVDQFSDKYLLVRAIGDSEGDLISSVELQASTDGYTSLIDCGVPLINWCNVKVIQSTYSISRAVGLPVTLTGLGTDFKLDGRLNASTSDGKTPQSFSELLMEQDETVPQELEKLPPRRDSESVQRMLNVIEHRDLAKIRVEIANAMNSAQNSTAKISASPSAWRFEFDCSVETDQTHFGVVLALPSADIGRLQSKAVITPLKAIGDTTYVYLDSIPAVPGQDQQLELNFWIEQKRDSDKASFDVPAIQFVSLPKMRCSLTIESGHEGDVIWDTNAWSKTESVDARKGQSEKSDEVSPQYVSSGKIVSIHAERKASASTELRIPFAYGSIEEVDKQYFFQGLLGAVVKGTNSTNVEVPRYLQSAAVLQLTGSGLDSNQWQLIREDDRGPRQLTLSLIPSDVPHLIAIRGVIPADRFTPNLEILSKDFKLVTNDGTQAQPDQVYLGLVPGSNLLVPNVAAENYSDTMMRLANELLTLENDYKASVDRLSQNQLQDYLSAWSEFTRETGIAGLENSTYADQAAWVAKYRGVFESAYRSDVRLNLSDSVSWNHNSRWYSALDGKIQLVKTSTNSSQRILLVDIFRLALWLVPTLLLTLLALPTYFATHLRTMLSDYPWRLLCLVAMVMCILPGMLWLALLMSVAALVVCITGFYRNRYTS